MALSQLSPQKWPKITKISYKLENPKNIRTMDVAQNQYNGLFCVTINDLTRFKKKKKHFGTT